MAKVPAIDWKGKSGKTYRYWIYPLPPNFKAEPGNYIFAKEPTPGRWTPIYIGQTENLNERFEDHHAMPCIKRNGATHINGHLNSDKQARLNEESDLLAQWNTPCNG